jgi:NAD(P)-dependent dehydrogenase (short-subunit alcohol dehydrogenase family)
MRFDLTGRVALVTGAGQGMGVGAARALAEQGAAVAVNDLVPEKARAVATDLGDAGLDARAVAFDVTDADAVRAGVGAVNDDLGPIDILVNNAGVPVGMEVAPFRRMEPGRWSQYIDLNIYGSLNCIAAVIDGMCERHWGRVIQISSGAGRHGLAFGVSLYGAGKSGIEGFIRHLAMEVAADGVTANALALGLMANTAGGDVDAVAALARGIPVRRLGTPEDVGAAVAFLASDEASYLTAQTINLSGGSLQN